MLSVVTAIPPIADCGLACCDILGRRRAGLLGLDLSFLPNIEKPEEFNRLVYEFVREPEAAA